MKAPNIRDFSKNNKLAASSDQDLQDELERRKIRKPFPLDVFHENIKPFIANLVDEYDLPRAYVGLSMLSAYSSAIGSSYHVKLNKLGDIYFPVWACLEGISSQGKSLVMNQVFKPLFNIQEEIEKDWFDQIENMTDDAVQKLPSKQLIYSETHIPTLIKDVMPSNPKGILQDADEILAWVNGMNQLSKGSKEGTDEQFWMKSWNCKSHRKRLAGNKQFVIKRPFLNVFGGAQPSIMWKLFKNDRATTGFIFRLLFAVPEVSKIAEPSLTFDMPSEIEQMHEKSLRSLYLDLPMDDDEDSRPMFVDVKALQIYHEWSREKITEINTKKDVIEKELTAGIMGKIKEYCLRFAGILHLSDKSYEGREYGWSEKIDVSTMQRAIKLADYFYESAMDITERVNDKVIATPEVLRFSHYIKSGISFQKIGTMEYPDLSESAARMKASRVIKRYIKEYPKIFNAVNHE